MTKLKVSDIKKQLKTYDQKMLIQLITELYKLNPEVQQYMAIEINGDDAVRISLDNAKKEIINEFFPNKGHGKMRLSAAKKAISDFKKLSNDYVRLVDLMLYYVEIGTRFTNTYGDIDSRFYSSMGSMFDQVSQACDENEELFTTFADRLEAVVSESEGIGWGYSDYLFECYYSIQWVESE